MKLKLLALAQLFFLFSLSAQNQYWTQSNLNSIVINGPRYIYPNSFEVYNLDYLQMKSYLFAAPMQDLFGNVTSSSFEIALPLPDGSFENFKVVESPSYELGFREIFPDIKTFLAYCPNHPEWYTRLDITPQGFHALILGTEKGSIYIDPVSHTGLDTENYFVYYKKDYQRANEQMVCEVESIINEVEETSPPSIIKSFGTCELRTYRLAVSATGEYTAFQGGTVALAAAAQVTTMNRVNGVFEKDMAIHMNIIANNNLIIYTNGGTDPFTNGTPGTMINENQTNTNAVIGSANYDIGHVFGTNSGGLAQLRSPCGTNKARGVTGSSAPVGDPFDIDYVAHEMGHQYGANHSFNNSCGGNRNNATAMEPGSASSIMGYAGICNPNVQNNSDDYFHGINMEEMGDFITGTGNSCAVKTPLPNASPSVSVPATTYSIPANTPFSLTAFGSDPNASNVLTYCWEQMDNGIATMPPVSTSTVGPNFRSLDPSTDPTRYFPNLADVIAGNSPTWEVLSSVSRSMNFRVVLRDNSPGGGCNDHEDVSVNVVGSAGPFVVNSPSNIGITWAGNSTQTVTWSVANTTAAPISCANVNILISYNGGLSFPDTLASNVSNDGSQSVLVPNIATNNALIIVQCANGTFYDVSNNSFTITAITNDFSFTSSSSANSICLGDTARYSLQIGLIGTFNNNVNLSVSALPAGLNASFSANGNPPSFNSELELTNTGGIAPGTYNFSVQATSTSGSKTLNFSLTIVPSLSGALNLTSPSNGASGIPVATNFSWTNIANANYEIEISTTANFTNIVETASGLSSNSYTSTSLNTNTSYYWRVRASNICDEMFSAVFSFTTENCAVYASTDIPVSISSSGTPTITSDLTISGLQGIITDLNVVDLSGTHTYINDLIFTLSSPNGTDVILLDRICGSQNNFDIQFDDAAANNNYPCPPTNGASYIPEEALSAFNGEDANGTWTLTIQDVANQDGGNLNAWAIEICLSAPPCQTSFDSVFVAGCDSAFSNGQWYYSSTLAYDTLSAAAGCDSIMVYSVTINSSKNTSSTLVACDSVQVAGTWYTSSQALIQNLSTNASCDSTHTINITINHGLSASSNQTACDSAFVYGNWYFSSQAISSSFTASNNCDSIHTINLSIKQSSTPTQINLTTCNPNQVGSSSQTFLNANGCDSVVTTITSLLPSASSTQNFVGCDSVQVLGNWYYSSTSFTNSYVAANNCDSLATFQIQVNPSKTSSSVVASCDSAFVAGNWYTSSQAISQSYNSSAGCDSTHTFNIQINPAINTSSSLVSCDSAFVLGAWYSSSQAIANTLSAVGGCDSIHTINLVINQSSPVTNLAATSCNPANVGSITQLFINSVGCDSIVITTTTLSPSSSSMQNQVGCDSLQVLGNWYFNTTSFTNNFVAANGCDSVVTYNLTIHASETSSSAVVACDSAFVLGNWYYSSQSISQSYINSLGCDSTHTFNIQINSSFVTSSNLATCDSAFIAGSWYYNSQAISINYGAQNGCDSTHTFHLSISNSSSPNQIYLSSCDPNNVGTTTQLYSNANGCDSLVITTTSLLPSFTTSQSIYGCDSLELNGSWYFSSTSFSNSFVAANGCDSTHISNVFIGTDTTTYQSLSGCDSLSYNGQVYTSSQQLSATFSGSNFCDSTHIINLNVISIDTSLTVFNDTALANQLGATYQWIDCNSNLELLGETDSLFITSASGLYAVEISLGGCVELSSCVPLTVIGIKENDLAPYISVYPNPSSGTFYLNFSLSLEDLELRIYTVEGKLIQAQYADQASAMEINLNASQGLYLLDIRSKQGSSILKLIKD
ncbi:MAG: M12 family metallo-peptidase [Chitinophagales bacterium]